MTLRSICLAALMCAGATSAFAQQQDTLFKQPYVKVSGGVLTSGGDFETTNEDVLLFSDESNNPEQETADWTQDFGTGSFLAVSAGVRPLKKLRVEVEFSRASSSADTAEVTNVSDGRAPFFNRDADSKASSLSILINGWYDVATFRKASLFVGGGIGITRLSVESDIDNPPAASPNSGVSVIIPGLDESKITYGAQIGAGASYEVTPNWTVGSEVRYYKKVDADLDNTDFKFGGLVALASVSFTFQDRKPKPDAVPREPINEL